MVTLAAGDGFESKIEDVSAAIHKVVMGLRI